MVEPCLIDARKCRTVQGFQVDTLHFSPETGTRGDHLRRIGVAQGVGLPFRTQIHTTVPDMLCLSMKVLSQCCGSIVSTSSESRQVEKANGPRKQVIQPPNYRPTPSPLSPAILVGDTLYMSGAPGADPKAGQLVKGGFEPELRQIMSNLQTVLKSADMDLSDVVAVTA